MLVLLPPSEGKAAGEKGAVLDLATLSLPGLTEARSTVLAELIALCSGDSESGDGGGGGEKARGVLGIGEGLRGEIAKNARLREAPAVPAGELYTGVLYDALSFATLSPAAKQRAERSLLVFSGLWGAVGLADRIPSYRCSGGVKLPGTGPLGAYWRKPLETVMPEAAGQELVLDLRSTAYAGMWKPKGELAERTATVRVLHSKTVDGVEKRSVVSHFNKATKGRIVRELLEQGSSPRSPEGLAETLRELGHTVEWAPAAKAGKPTQLDVIVTEL